MKRFRLTIEKHGLRDYDIPSVQYVFNSSSPKDAIRRVDKVLKRAKETGSRISFFAREFLEGVAISAQTDLYDEENKSSKS